ncbi:hypothetical protein DQF64_01435 [Moraxella bovis]|nr:hypothetical protein DQF64_01435 [Moraxella bovis]
MLMAIKGKEEATMNTNEQELKNNRIKLMQDIFGSILLVCSLVFLFVVAGIPMIASVKVSQLAKDYKNIRDDGCLLYASKSDKHGGSMFYLNQKGPYTLRQISIYPEKSDRQLGKLIRESGLSYYDFERVYSKECIRVRYIHSKTLWASGDHLYDFY